MIPEAAAEHGPLKPARLVLSKFPGSALAVLIILTTCAALWALAARTSFLVCDTNCGETLLAVYAANKFAENGAQFGLLENLGTSVDPALYTHSVNIGTLTFVFLEWLGVHEFSIKSLLPLAVYGIGLFYVFLTVRRFSRSTLAGICALLFFATTYWAVGSFALNALRAWHTMAFFGSIYHASLLKSRVWHLIGLIVAAIVAFGCGYDFWIICGAASLAIILINRDARSLRAAIFVGVAFFIPFALRQVHVASVLGTSYWWQDFVYSIGIKVPYADKILKIPPLSEIDAWYRSQHVFRPPAQPGNSAAQMFYTFRHMIEFVTLPRWGFLSLLTFIGVLIAGVVPYLRTTIIGHFSYALVLPITIGATIGLVALAPFSLHVYFKHEFPLVAYPLLLAKAVVVYAAIASATQSRRHAAASAAVVVLYVADAALTHWNNSAHGHYPNLGWIPFVVQQSPEDVTLAAFRYRQIADPLLIHTNKSYHYIVPEHVGSATTRFVVYQPVDRIDDFDSARPLCSWTDWFRQFAGIDRPRPPGTNCIYGSPIAESVTAQPSLDEAIALLPNYKLVARSDRGIGYIILERQR